MDYYANIELNFCLFMKIKVESNSIKFTNRNLGIPTKTKFNTYIV